MASLRGNLYLAFLTNFLRQSIIGLGSSFQAGWSEISQLNYYSTGNYLQATRLVHVFLIQITLNVGFWWAIKLPY